MGRSKVHPLKAPPPKALNDKAVRLQAGAHEVLGQSDCVD